MEVFTIFGSWKRLLFSDLKTLEVYTIQRLPPLPPTSPTTDDWRFATTDDWMMSSFVRLLIVLTGTLVELSFSVFFFFFGGLGTDVQLVFLCLVAFLWWVGNGWLVP